jgi:hypothetical protein
MAVIRLDELAQSYVPLSGELVRTILNSQRHDGGWGDVMVTALCLRALMCGRGHGVAIDFGLEALASLQKEEGIWPAMPVRRMPADAFASAFMMLQLGDMEEFRKAVRFEAAMEWFESNDLALDEDIRRLWNHTKRRATRVRCMKAASLPGTRSVLAGPTGLAASAASSSGSPHSSATPAKGFWDFSAALNAT